MRTIGIILLLFICSVVYAATPRTLNGGCSVVFGSTEITTATRICQVPDTATLVEIALTADAGTPSVTMQRFRPNGSTTVDLTSSALTSGSAGAIACSRSTASTSINGTTSCGATLQNTSLSKGDWLQLKTAPRASTATLITIAMTWQW